MLLPICAGIVEPKLALKRNFRDGDRRTLWRTMCRFDPATLEALKAPEQWAYRLLPAEWIDATLSELRALMSERVREPSAAPDFTSGLKEWFSTHPGFARRIAAIRAG